MNFTHELYDAYNGDEPFLFVSYSHVDTERVKSVLRVLFLGGLRVWYDQGGDGVPLATSWREWIDNRLDKSRAFLAFITNGVESRPEVLREIQVAIERNQRESDEKYKVIFVFMERVPITVFPEKIRNFMAEKQFIPMYKYGGLTDSFVDRILNPELLPSEIVDDSFRESQGLCKWGDRKTQQTENRKVSEELQSESKYIYYTAEPKIREKDGVTFYAVGPEQIDQRAVYPLCLDNQWSPYTLINNKEFLEKGFRSEEIQNILLRYQQKEIFESLLHNWQMIVNRASLYNSRFFSRLYHGSEEDRDAFVKLLECGAVVPYLMFEDTPCQKPKFDAKDFASWSKICREHEVYCLRLNWRSEENNRVEAERALSYSFQNYLLTTADDKHRIRELEESLMIPADKLDAFRRRWQDVQLSVIGSNRASQSTYNRENFYKQYVVKENTKVSECHMDLSKPFAWEMKQIIDLRYALGLPLALKLRPVLPESSWCQSLIMRDLMIGGNYREITADELNCAIGLFTPGFLEETVKMPQATFEKFSLADIAALRNMDEWRSYMSSVTTGSKRAHLNEIDFYDILDVWVRYKRWMDACAVKQEFVKFEWAPVESCISIVYRFGNVTLVTVYHGSGGKLEILPPNQGHEAASAVTRKVPLTIDYVCGDVLAPQFQNQCVLTELRLFEGMTSESGGKAYQAAVRRLQGENNEKQNG